MLSVVHYWAGCPSAANSKWQSYIHLIEKCRNQGWRNYMVWSKLPEKPLYEPFKKIGCEIILQPRSKGNFDILSVLRTYNVLRRLRCDIFHCYNDHTSPLIGAALAGVPIRIWSKLSMSRYYEEGTSPRGLHRFMPSMRVSCLLSTRILPVSNEVGREIIEYVGNPAKIDVVCVPVNYHRFANAIRGNVREELGFDQSNIVITSVGHAVPVKGWDVAIKAFVQVFQKHKQARMILVGAATSTGYLKQLTEMLKQNKMEDYIKFTGRRDDIAGILKSSDIFIFPSRSEGMPAALIEAMAASLPCVAARVGGVPEVIEHGENGFLFEREISEELARYVIRLIEDQSLRTRFATKASICAREFSMESYVDEIFTIYKNLIAKMSYA